MDYLPPQTIINPPAIEWRLQGAQRVDEAVLRPLLGEDAHASGDAVAKAYKARGILAVRVRIDGTDKERTLRITEGTIRASGHYARYLPAGDVLTQDALDASLARARAEARANNDVLVVRIGKVQDDGAAEVVLDGIPGEPANAKRLAWSATSFGPRYSGADVLTLSGYAALGNGWTADAGITTALSDLRDDSKGGRYLGLNGSVSKATLYGLFSVRGSYSDFKVGGPNRDLGQTGEVAKVDAEWSYALTPNFTPYLGLGFTHQVSAIGAAGWDDTVKSTAAKAGLRAQKVFTMTHGMGSVSADLGLEHGLALSRTTNAPGPLLGDIDKNYRAVSLDASVQLPVSAGGAVVSLSGGSQHASDGTPSGAQFYAGGPSRGVAYHAGVYAAPSGYYAAVQYTTGKLDDHLGLTSDSTIHDVKAFVGLDGAVVRPSNGGHLTAKSAQVGVRFGLGKNINAQVGYAAPLGGNDQAKGRLTFYLTGSF